MNHGAYILARYSTDRQNEDTIEVQVERCSAWCRQAGLEVLDVFADLAVSGMKDTRPEYDRMMRQLREGGADTVVMYDQSRVFRKMINWFQFRDELESLGVRVVSVTQPVIGGDLRDPSSFLMEGSMALFNQMWVLQTRQKVVEKMRYMAKNGQHTGGTPPLGYRVEDGALTVDEAEAETVRLIFARYAAGSTYGEIIQELAREGRRTRTGKAFGANSLHDLLRNERYIGTIVYGKTRKRADGSRNTHGAPPEDCIRIENGCPAIVDPETWTKVQARMEANRHVGHGGRPATRPQPLKGKVFCGACGAAMNIAYSGHGKRYAYYDCTRKKRQRDCDNLPIRAEVLEHTVAEAVRDMFRDAVNMRTLERTLRSARDNVRIHAGPSMQQLVGDLSAVKKKLDIATDALLSGVTSQTLRDKINSLEAEKSRIEMQMRQLKAATDRTDYSDAEISALLEQLIHAAESDDAAVLALVLRVEVDRDQLRIWTIIDSPDWTDTPDDQKPSAKTVATLVPLAGTDFRISLGDTSPAPQDIRNPHLIIAFCVFRPRKREPQP